MTADETDDPTAHRSDTSNSRRGFLAGTGALGALALGSAFSTPVLASDEHGDEDASGDDEFEDDVAVLNYARTLEALEYRFYEAALDNIDEDDLACYGPFEEADDSVSDHVYEALEVVRDHEETHFETLGAVVEDLGGEPVEEPEFDFGSAVEEPDEFVATAVVLEDTGVGAYAGAAPSIENEDVVTSALSIHSVEARHASFLRVLDMQVPFPNAFDEALSRSEVLDRASQFIVEE
ncbi:ferritin-like domain-containing protein [Halobacterium sp. R2-5]|uniref:ferritin-like domain-containing protein n=1 Tax=Halobacterium sp. R2-5 TaxID=2715751 RepID=UPI001421EB76|nr:ferritin-like domain-containing protein [Halobacterium sp. R2-5]NIB98633.1 ferritin-like domain-containing protein [Halobacterium sp. R2-5]